MNITIMDDKIVDGRITKQDWTKLAKFYKTFKKYIHISSFHIDKETERKYMNKI